MDYSHQIQTAGWGSKTSYDQTNLKANDIINVE